MVINHQLTPCFISFPFSLPLLLCLGFFLLPGMFFLLCWRVTHFQPYLFLIPSRAHSFAPRLAGSGWRCSIPLGKTENKCKKRSLGRCKNLPPPCAHDPLRLRSRRVTLARQQTGRKGLTTIRHLNSREISTTSAV